MKLTRKTALPFIAGGKKKTLWSMKDILILEECIVCETSQTFLGLMLHLVDVWFFVWLGFFLAGEGFC